MNTQQKILFSTLLYTFIACFTACPMQPNTAAQQQTSSETLTELQRNFEELERNTAALAQELPNLQRDLEQLEQNANRPSSLEQVIIATPSIRIINAPDSQISLGIGLYGEDIVNILAWFAEYGLDWYLFYHFKKFNIENVTENLLEKHEKILSYLEKLNIKKSTQEVIPNQYARKLDAFFKKECFIDLNIKRTLTSELLSKIITYIFSNECVKAAKYTILPQQHSIIESYINWALTQADRADARRRNELQDPNQVYNISISTIISIVLGLVFFSPLKTFLNIYSDVLTASSRFFDCRLQFFDSYLFQLLKRFFLLVYFSRQLNKKYQELWSTFITKNAFELKTILSAYAIAKAQGNIKNVEAIKQQLTNLVDEGHAYSFIWWIRFKNTAFSKTNAVIETLLALPLFYQTGKYVYNYIYHNNL